VTAPAKSAGSGQDLVRTGAPPSSAVERVETPSSEPTVARLLQLALEKGTPVESLEKLVALHERVEERNARRAFFEAMAAFQAECPPIHKASTAEITTNKGGKYKYTYAELDEIARTINPFLAKHGLSYSWNSKVDGKALTCWCTARHRDGYSGEPVEFTLPIDNPSAMSDQQKVGAALTFAKRQTLTSAFGLVTTDDDTDAAEVDPTPVSEDQLLVLEDLLTESGADRARFLKYLGVDKIEDLPRIRFQEAVTALEQKKGRRP
jgi:hypothetical protein